MALNLFSYFRRSEENKIGEAKSIVIVCNQVDHMSLLAACLYHIAMTVIGRKTQLLDIRDNIPFGADGYIWIACCDSAADVQRFVEKQAIESNYLRNWALTVGKKSVFIMKNKLPALCFEDTLIGKAMAHFWENFFKTDEIYATDVSRNNPVFSIYGMLSEKWLTNTLGPVEMAGYLNTILYCYAGMVGTLMLNLSEFESNIYTSEEDAEKVITVYTTLNKTIARSCRDRVVDGVNVLYITKLGPEIYPLIRLISLAGRAFYHVSEGVFGSVIYRSTK